MLKYYRTSFPFSCAIIIFISIFSCKKKDQTTTATSKKDSITVTQKVISQNQQDSLNKSKIKYSAFIFPNKKKDSAMKAFKEKYSADERHKILALNRLDEKNSWRADTLIIPSDLQQDFLKFSPFAVELPILKEVKKLVYFSYPIQAFAVYENGKLQRWGPTSMGKKAAKTATGLQFTNWKSKIATSTVDSDWKLPYNVNIANRLGIGWHEYDLPGFPASHSCLRLLKDDAKWLYGFADQWILSADGNTLKAHGIPVIVNGDYPWGERKPWRNLLDNSMANYLSEQTLSEQIKPYLDEILAAQKERAEVLDHKN